MGLVDDLYSCEAMELAVLSECCTGNRGVRDRMVGLGGCRGYLVLKNLCAHTST
jgi:hypothetical protein